MNQFAVIIVTLIDIAATITYICAAPLGLMGVVDRIVAAIHTVIFGIARAISALAKIPDGIIDAVLRISPCYP